MNFPRVTDEKEFLLATIHRAENTDKKSKLLEIIIGR